MTLPNRRRNRSRQGNVRSRRLRPNQQQSRQLTQAVRDLSIVTMDRPMPDLPDVARIRGPQRQPIYTFHKNVTLGTLIASQFEEAKAFSFTLNDIPNPSDLVNLFDEYRIIQVTVKFLPVTALFGASTSSTNYPSIYSAIDYNDDTLPSGAANLREYATFQCVPNQQYTQRTISVRSLTAVNNNGTIVDGGSRWGQWLRVAQNQVKHYGLKTIVSPVTTASGSFVLYNVEAEYVVQCKNVK